MITINFVGLNKSDILLNILMIQSVGKRAEFKLWELESITSISHAALSLSAASTATSKNLFSMLGGCVRFTSILNLIDFMQTCLCLNIQEICLLWKIFFTSPFMTHLNIIWKLKVHTNRKMIDNSWINSGFCSII